MTTVVMTEAGPETGLPRARGELSDAVMRALTGALPWSRLVEVTATDDEDALRTLWIAHELHHRGLPRFADAEWTPELVVVRRRLEGELEQRLRARAEGHQPESATPDALLDFVRQDAGPSLSAYVQRSATREQVLELLWLRSIYHLKEADPTTWTLPRLPGPARAALAELQYDEYGGGRPARLHAELFARGLRACGLDARENAAIDDVPVEVLEMNVTLTMFGLQRRLAAASIGHLVAFEASSSAPSRRMARGLRRLGLPEEIAAYYDEHVEADAVHEQTAARFIAGAMLRADPTVADDLAFGAFTCLDLERRFAASMFRRWGVRP